jgi:hypothetical protein
MFKESTKTRINLVMDRIFGPIAALAFAATGILGLSKQDTFWIAVSILMFLVFRWFWDETRIDKAKLEELKKKEDETKTGN